MEYLITITGALIWIAISILGIFFGIIALYTLFIDSNYGEKFKKW